MSGKVAHYRDIAFWMSPFWPTTSSSTV